MLAFKSLISLAVSFKKMMIIFPGCCYFLLEFWWPPPLPFPEPSMSLTFCRRHGFLCNYCECCWKSPAKGRALSFLFFFFLKIWGIASGRYWNSNSQQSAVSRTGIWGPFLKCWVLLAVPFGLYVVLPGLCDFISHGSCKTCKIMCTEWNSKASMAKWNAFFAML